MYGRLSDIFGRKPCLLVSLAIFFIGALGCSVSQSMIMLIVFRAVAGVGGGGILTLTGIIGEPLWSHPTLNAYKQYPTSSHYKNGENIKASLAS